MPLITDAQIEELERMALQTHHTNSGGTLQVIARLKSAEEALRESKHELERFERRGRAEPYAVTVNLVLNKVNRHFAAIKEEK